MSLLTGKQTLTSSQRWVLATTGVASFLVALDTLIVSTALSALRADLHVSLTSLEWTVDAYVLSFAVLMMAASALGDLIGRRRMLGAGLGLFGAASVLCAVAPSIGWLIFGRVVQGAGAAAVMPLALTLLSVAFGPRQRAWAMGVFSSVIGLSMLAGPLLGGAVVEAISWHWIFWINVPVVPLIILALATRVPESSAAGVRLDLPGVALVSVAALGIVWGLVRSSAGWGHAEVLGALGVGGLATCALVAWEARAAEPMLPLGLFADRVFSAATIALFCLQAALVGALFFMAQYLQTTLGYGPLETGLRLMPWGATVFLVPHLAGRLIPRVGERRFCAGGLGLYAASMAWIAIIARDGLPYWQLVAPLLLSGSGFAIAAPAMQSAALGTVRPEQVGRAAGALSTLRQLGAAFGVAVLATVFAGAGSYASPAAFNAGFSAALGACAAIAAVGAAAGLLLPGARRAAARDTVGAPGATART